MTNPAKPTLTHITTGDKELDKLLSSGPEKNQRGLPIGIGVGKKLIETTVVLIEGDAGVGKTTLALQIASRGAKESKGTVVFLSLEQSASSIMNAVQSFNFPEEVFPVPKKNSDDTAIPKAGTVRLCRLSPLPLFEQSREEIFKARFAELETIVKVLSECITNKRLLVLDSLNAFTGYPLTRSQIYQLFSLFRLRKVPTIATLERPDRLGSCDDSFSEVEGFLADIVVKLTRETHRDHLQSFLEVSKSRVCLQGLGKHLFKTRTVRNPEQIGQDKRTGIVIYPSVHFMVSRTRTQSKPISEERYYVASELKTILLDDIVRQDSCFAVTGPAGTHKLALGLNLSIGYVENKAKTLVINFGGQGDTNFSGVAWTKSQQYLGKLEKNGDVVNTTKYRRTEYIASVEGGRSASVSSLTFNIGMLTPEEFVFSVDQILAKAINDNDRYHSVLLSDTAELCTGFPLLSKDPVFFAALLNLFEINQLVTVGIGVAASDHPSLRDMNLTLMAKATHRIVLRHFPDIQDLMQDKVFSCKIPSRPINGPQQTSLNLDEQLVSAVIDNVTGKHYSRKPKWVSVNESSDGKTKTLLFSEFNKPMNK